MHCKLRTAILYASSINAQNGNEWGNMNNILHIWYCPSTIDVQATHDWKKKTLSDAKFPGKADGIYCGTIGASVLEL